MITMIGTGHVFKIAEQVSFVVRHTWPEAVLVELDEKRYSMLMNDTGEKKATSNQSKLYRESAEYQNKISERNNTQPGGELLAAIVAGKLLGADIICIDKDAEQTMREVEEEMSLCERARYSTSSVTDKLLLKSRADASRRDFVTDDEEYIRRMRKKYPTLVQKLIDERNVYMSEQIREASEKYNSIVVIVGDAHVRGICDLLAGAEIDKIRLADMLNPESMNSIKSRIWNKKADVSE
jgi:pheromone shutdown protein TraB